MLPTLLLAAFTVVLFLYWQRCNCVLILRRQFARDRVAEVAAANGLRLPELRRQLHAHPRLAELPGLYRQVVREYRILAGLVRYTATFQGGSFTFEQFILAVDFRVMQLLFLASHLIAPRQARVALSEALRVLEYFANVVGERAVPARAR